MYPVLASKVEGNALDQVRNRGKKGELRGLLAWKEVQETAQGEDAQRLGIIMEKANNPSKCQRITELP